MMPATITVTYDPERVRRSTPWTERPNTFDVEERGELFHVTAHVRLTSAAPTRLCVFWAKIASREAVRARDPESGSPSLFMRRQGEDEFLLERAALHMLMDPVVLLLRGWNPDAKPGG